MRIYYLYGLVVRTGFASPFNINYMPNEFNSYFKTHEDYLNWYRNYREKNREKLREYHRKYNKEWRKINGYHNEKKWKKNNPLKFRVEKKLSKAIKNGKIIRGKCEICGEKNALGHHENYNKSFEVRWLCPLHHKHVHLGKIELGIKSA